MSRATAETHLVNSALMYVTQAIATDDRAALRELNLGDEEVEALGDIKLVDLGRVADFRGHCLNISFDIDSLWLMLKRYHEQREVEKLRRALIAADASQPMMQHFFGMTSNEYAKARHRQGLRSHGGRYRRLPEDVSHRVYRLWANLKGQREDLDAAAYLHLHQVTGACLRALWPLTRRWLERDESFRATLPSVPPR